MDLKTTNFLSVRLTNCLALSLSMAVCQYVCLFIFPAACLSVHLPICLFRQVFGTALVSGSKLPQKLLQTCLATNLLPITQAFSDVGGLPFLGVALQLGRELATATHETITLLLDTASFPPSQISHTAALLARLQVLQYYSRLLIPIKTELHPENIAGFFAGEVLPVSLAML